MPISNPEAVGFCNAHIRPSADFVSQAYWRAKQMRALWDANEHGLVLTGNEVVEDGAHGANGDGRTVITGNDVAALVSAMQVFTDAIESVGGAYLAAINKVVVNPTR